MWRYSKTYPSLWTRILGHTRDSILLEPMFPKEHTEKQEFLSTPRSKSPKALNLHQEQLEWN